MTTSPFQNNLIWIFGEPSARTFCTHLVHRYRFAKHNNRYFLNSETYYRIFLIVTSRTSICISQRTQHISIMKINLGIILYICTDLYVKCLLFLFGLTKIAICRNISVKVKLHEDLSSVSRARPCYRQTNRWVEEHDVSSWFSHPLCEITVKIILHER